MSAGRVYFAESEKTCLLELIVKYKLNTKATFGASDPAHKRAVWARLTQEFNSIETNNRRTESQLKKCWDNLKSRRKQVLALEKRERMRTGGGSYEGPSTSSTQPTDSSAMDDALMESTDVELQFAIDSDTAVTGEALAQVQQVDVPDDDSRVRTSSQTPHCSTQAKNIRAHVISEEFDVRKENYKRSQIRDEELHQLRIVEHQWKVKAAEESYKKALVERESAEELRALKKEEAELIISNLKKC